MDYYFVNKEALENGAYEIHRGGCLRCAAERNRIYLGFYPDWHDALTKAGEFFCPVSGCPLCCGPAHFPQSQGQDQKHGEDR